MITSEEHFAGDRSGAVYSAGAAAYPRWAGYLERFDEIVVIARIKGNQEPESGWQRADGPGVSFSALPDFSGPWHYLRVRHAAQAIARKVLLQCDSCLVRVPGVVGQMVWREITRSRRPYAAEVLGDPWDALSPGSWPDVSRPFFRLFAARQLKQISSGAAAVHYAVSADSRKRYPPAQHAFATTFSDVVLEPAAPPANLIRARQRRIRELPWQVAGGETSLAVGFIGSFSRMYKGADVLLRASALCRDRGLRFSLDLAGEGRHLSAMKKLAANLALTDRTRFRGQLAFGQEICDFIDALDLLVMPSRAEGIPRALIEAMSRGCPCVGTAVGGIPELLNCEDVVPSGDFRRLAELVLRIAGDSERLLAMSERNLAAAAQFKPERMQQARLAFLDALAQ